MDDIGIFYVHLVFLNTSIWYNLWPFCIFYGYLVYFYHFGMLYQEKSGKPGSKGTYFFK
jgi:hypothetical protein